MNKPCLSSQFRSWNHRFYLEEDWEDRCNIWIKNIDKWRRREYIAPRIDYSPDIPFDCSHQYILVYSSRKGWPVKIIKIHLIEEWKITHKICSYFNNSIVEILMILSSVIRDRLIENESLSLHPRKSLKKGRRWQRVRKGLTSFLLYTLLILDTRSITFTW